MFQEWRLPFLSRTPPISVSDSYTKRVCSIRLSRTTRAFVTTKHRLIFYNTACYSYVKSYRINAYTYFMRSRVYFISRLRDRRLPNDTISRASRNFGEIREMRCSRPYTHIIRRVSPAANTGNFGAIGNVLRLTAISVVVTRVAVIV